MHTLSRLVAFAVLLWTLYISGFFLFPWFFDVYGINTFNTMLRSWKEKIESINTPPIRKTSPVETIYRSGIELFSGSRETITLWIEEGKKLLEKWGNLIEEWSKFVDTTKNVLQKTASGINTTVDTVTVVVENMMEVKDILFSSGKLR